ncbi:TPA: hypothetical protein L1N65_003784 [Escherichia coli]|nr:hypothetical protein [Escherichia coli]HBN0662196.1 hypothetical protein [Escherichia coli]HBN0694422.1 hypothetical protein [Escherichia coli]HBN0776203.1 hypothetical protein [Escherichia coli]HBN0827958.1 hypothetical protein [Escherichia coli]
MIKVEIKPSQVAVDERSGEKDGKSWVSREQQGYLRISLTFPPDLFAIFVTVILLVSVLLIIILLLNVLNIFLSGKAEAAVPLYAVPAAWKAARSGFM